MHDPFYSSITWKMNYRYLLKPKLRLYNLHIRISHAEVPWNFVDWHDWTEMAINNIITFFFFFDMLLLGTGQGTYYCVHDIGQGHKKQYLYVLLQAVSVVSGTFWKGFLGGQLVVYILVYGGFHLHLLIFRFVYQFNYRIVILVCSSFPE